MDITDLDLFYNNSPPASLFTPSFSGLSSFKDFPNEAAAPPSFLQPSEAFWTDANSLPLRSSASTDSLTALLSSSRALIEQDGYALRPISSEERLDRLLGLQPQQTPSISLSTFTQSAPQPSVMADHVMAPSIGADDGLLDSFSFKEFMDDIFEIKFNNPPIQMEDLPLGAEFAALPSVEDLPIDQPKASKRQGKRSAARVAQATIKRIIDDIAPVESFDFDTTFAATEASSSPYESHSSGKMKGSAELRNKRRANHRQIDLGLSDAELAERLLGVDQSQYSTLSVAQRNIVASARYRQKKMERQSTLEKAHEALRTEYTNLKAELAAIESEIASYRASFSNHMTLDFLD